MKDAPQPQTLVARPAQRRTLPEEIVSQLLQLIASNGIAEVRLPPERVLCEQLGVSRASLREALSALGHLGVVVTRGKRKVAFPARARNQLVARVAALEPERDLMSDPMEVRRMLEPEVAAKAAERASMSAIAEIEHLLLLMEESVGRGERVVEYDSAFHVSIARATENRTLIAFVAGLTDALGPSRELSFQPDEAANMAIRGHRAILAALQTRDPSRARKAMADHLDEVEELIRASLSSMTEEDFSEI